MKLGLPSHWPSAAHAPQLELVSLHADLHTPQLTGHLRWAKSGFLPHSPRCAQPAHLVRVRVRVRVSADAAARRARTTCALTSGTWSLHSGVQIPQLVGQWRSMKSALLPHSPPSAHATHVELASEQACSQMPHERGHVRFMTATTSACVVSLRERMQGGKAGVSSNTAAATHTRGCRRSVSPSPTGRTHAACRCTWTVRAGRARPRRPRRRGAWTWRLRRIRLLVALRQGLA